VKICQFGCVKETLIAFDKAEPNGAGTKTSAAPTKLFTVNEDCKKLKPAKGHGISQSGGQDFAVDQEIETRHKPCDSIFDDKSTIARQERLGQVDPSDATRQVDEIARADSVCQWQQHFEVVGGRVSCSSPKHERTLRGQIVKGSWLSHRWC
jgi:hypothetical protein